MRKLIVLSATLILCLFTGTSYAASNTVILDMNLHPSTEGWGTWNNGGNSWVAAGVLTIDSPSYYEFWAPNWTSEVDNAAGWEIETRMRVAESSGDPLRIWIHDNVNLTHVDIFTNKLSITYPDSVDYFMNTTDVFHTYNIQGQGDQMSIYVDGALAFNYTRTWAGGGTQTLYFGDGHGGGQTISEWDYFKYTTHTPVPEPASMLLLSGGLIGLAGFKKKQHKA